MAEARAGGTRARRRRPSSDPVPAKGEASKGGADRGKTTGDAPAEKARPQVCSVAFCPICTLVTAMGEARPELVEHLLLAGREVLLAARAVIDARLESLPPPPKLERLTIG
jgi:hypothetical protein